MKTIWHFTILSLRYWKKHSKRLITFAMVTILGTIALCGATLFIRSVKETVLNNELTLLGNYDAIFYEMNQGDIQFIEKCDKVSSYGYYNELGYASLNDGKQYKVASFPNTNSEELYHMTCTKGRYPIADDEIAIDVNTAKEMGVIPNPGGVVSLTLWDLERKELVTKEYRISGVYELSDASVEGGYYRYPTNASEGSEGYDMPVIFVSKDCVRNFSSKVITAFIQTDSNIRDTVNEIKSSGLSSSQIIEIPDARTYAYSFVLGTQFDNDGTNVENSISTLKKAMENGEVHMDFYSSILIPLFSLLILAVVVISIYSLVKNLLYDRAEEIAILRSLGMTRYVSVIYVFIELMVIAGIFILFGLIIASGLHYLIIFIMNQLWHLNLPLGFQVSTYVKAVTSSPYAYSFVVILLSCLFASLLPLVKMFKLTPIALFQKRLYTQKVSKKNHDIVFRKSNWRSVMNKHLKFHDVSAMVITAIVISAAFFGYNYFKAYSELQNTEYKYRLVDNGLQNTDYSVTRSKDVYSYEFGVENHHDYGIQEEAYTEFSNKDYIDKSFARILNNSTRLSYSLEDTTDDISTLLEQSNLRRSPASEDSYENSLHQAEEAMVNAIGYSSSENVYSLPSVGVMENKVEELTPYVKQGEIRIDKIKTGEEAILIVPSTMEELAKKVFQIGDALPLSDVTLSKEEDSYNFGHILLQDYADPVFRKMVTIPDSGEELELSSYAFGKRKNINVRIGAIVVLDDESMLNEYSVMNGKNLDEGASYSLSLVCLPETFDKWGLPDKLFTEASFTLNEGANNQTANEDWYKIMGSCSGISYNSSSEIKQSMEKNSGSIMAVYYLMIVLLVVVGILTIGIKFYSKIKMKNQSIARLRATGMSLGQLKKLIISQNLIYPVIGAVIAIIPTILCQQFFNYIKFCLDSGKWEGANEINGSIPWWHNIPFRYNLLAYHPVITLIILIAVFICLMLIASIPQIIYMRKQVIAENIDNDTF